MVQNRFNRRAWLSSMVAAPGAFVGLNALGSTAKAAPINPNDKIKVTKLETFVLKNSWVFVKISTDAGITGWARCLRMTPRLVLQEPLK